MPNNRFPNPTDVCLVYGFVITLLIALVIASIATISAVQNPDSRAEFSRCVLQGELDCNQYLSPEEAEYRTQMQNSGNGRKGSHGTS